MPRPSLLLGAFLALGLWGCGGGGGGGSSRASALTIVAASPRVAPRGKVAFAAIVKGGGRVAWSVVGGDASGTITESGLYTAPATQGTYTVQASVGGVMATRTIEVTNGITVALTSGTPPLTVPRAKLDFSAEVNGTTEREVTWSVRRANGAAVSGAITTAGVLTVPNEVGTYTVVATSKADATKTATVAVEALDTVRARFVWEGQTEPVVVELRRDKAPNTVANFVTLIDRGFYTGIAAHRYEPSGGYDLIQWGDPTSRATPYPYGTPSTVNFEANSLLHEPYAIGMARTNVLNSASSQVYVVRSAQPGFDGNYVVFGKAASGTVTIDALRVGSKIVSATVEPAP